MKKENMEESSELLAKEAGVNSETAAKDTGRDSKSAAEETGGEKEKNIRKEVLSWIRTFAITIGVVIVLLLFVIINAQVPSESMESTIMTHDRLIGFRFAYWFAEPQRGDIILFKFPVDESQTYIKRVIGLPGEKLTIRDGHIYINDSAEPLREDYLEEEWYWENDGYEFDIPEDCYFVMGDNRNNSQDSRFWAQDAMNAGLTNDPEEAVNRYTFVRKDKIKGKAIWVYYKHPRLINQNPYADSSDK